MKKLISKLLMVVCVLFVFTFQLVVSPPPAAAKWHDNSPDEGTDLTPYLVVGGLVIVGAVVYAVVHKSHDAAEDNTEEAIEEGSAVEFNGPSFCLLNEQARDLASAESVSGQNLMINPYVDVDLERLEHNQFTSETTTVTVKAGIVLNF